MRRWLTVAMAILLALTLAACRGSSKHTETSAAPVPTRHVKDLTGFTSGDDNIGCYIDTDSVRCDIDKRGWNAPTKPADCKLDYGQGIQMATGQKPGFVCAGDTALGGGKPLASGTAIKSGTIICLNDKQTFTCRDVKTKHGFTMDGGSYKLF